MKFIDKILNLFRDEEENLTSDEEDLDLEEDFTVIELEELDVSLPRETLYKEFEQKTDKNAVWGGRETKQFLLWLEKNYPEE